MTRTFVFEGRCRATEGPAETIDPAVTGSRSERLSASRRDNPLEGIAANLLLRSAADQFLQMFGVAGPLHRDLGKGAIDVAEVVGRQSEAGRSDVLLQPV